MSVRKQAAVQASKVWTSFLGRPCYVWRDSFHHPLPSKYARSVPSLSPSRALLPRQTSGTLFARTQMRNCVLNMQRSHKRTCVNMQLGDANQNANISGGGALCSVVAAELWGRIVKEATGYRQTNCVFISPCLALRWHITAWIQWDNMMRQLNEPDGDSSYHAKWHLRWNTPEI